MGSFSLFLSIFKRIRNQSTQFKERGWFTNCSVHQLQTRSTRVHQRASWSSKVHGRTLPGVTNSWLPRTNRDPTSLGSRKLQQASKKRLEMLVRPHHYSHQSIVAVASALTLAWAVASVVQHELLLLLLLVQFFQFLSPIQYWEMLPLRSNF